MECSIGVSTETVLQIDQFYTVVRKILKPADVSDCSASIVGVNAWEMNKEVVI